MRRHLTLITALSMAAASALPGEPPAGTPAEALGLAKGSVFEVPVPDPVLPETSDPGEKASRPPDYEGSPPRVPHLVEDFLPLTREENLCVDCHGLAEAGEGDPTPIPSSHYTDLRRAPERVGETLAGARWVCVSCHVAPTGAEPLVGNLFGEPGTPLPAREDRLPGS